MRNKIARRLTKYFALTLIFFALLAGILFSLMFARHTVDVTRRDLYAHASAIADTVAHFAEECSEGDCKGSGFKAYMRFISDAAISDLFLLDAQGSSVILGEMQLPDVPLADEAIALAMDVFETGEMASVGLSQGTFLVRNVVVCAPVFNAQGEVQLALVMRTNANTISHTLEDAFYMLTACLTIALVIAIAAAFYLSR